MKDQLARLSERTSALGNYHRKYLHIISVNIEALTSSLELQGMRDRVHLWNHSTEVPGEMDTLLETTSDTAQKLNFLGCYYALQFLHLNLRMVDIVKLELAAGSQRWLTGRKLMLEAGRMFRYLTKCYMERLIEIFLDNREVPEFVMLGVGTRADQDDIDLGIVHRQSEHSEFLNRAIGQLSAEMLKKATRLHFHLSEHVGRHSLAANIEEYEDMLARNNYDFVIVTEMLGAATILGSYELFDEFKVRVTNRFFYDPGLKENRYHEGYLRGILGEIRSLLTRPKPSEIIYPKDDGLRPMKSLLSALKLVYGVDKANAWYIIDELKSKNSEREPQYRDLEEALSFLELFRHLYQIMVAQDEDIILSDPGIEAMAAKIAEMLGFEKTGVVSAEDFMLVNYYEFLDKSNNAIEVLTGDLRKHLRKISVFNPIFSGEIHKKPGFKGNLAIDFIRASDFFKGITYWDDFLEELADENSLFYNEFIESLNELPERLRRKVASAYISGTRYDPASVVRFLVFLGEKAETDAEKSVFDLLSCLFIDEMAVLHDVSALLIHLVYAYPVMLNSFLALIDKDCLARFAELSRNEPTLPELNHIYKQLQALCNLHWQSSQFFKRHFHSILNKYPMFIKNLHNNSKLKEITSGFYSDLTSLSSLSERIEQLGDYYDLEFVRVSMLAMSGAPSEQTDAEFIEFTDSYTLTLYELCQKEIHLSLGYSLYTHDLFGLYATGGHAREQGFDDDYDMIVILDSSEADEIDYCNKIVGMMNSEILKRGILPHHRFADHFGSYVISLEQLAGYLEKGGENIFIDQSQVLSSRMLVGSRKLENKLQDQIIGPLVFARGSRYIRQMKNELAARHTVKEEDHLNDIKECPGGLRDIEMLLLMYKTKHKVRDPLSRKYLKMLVDIEPAHAKEFKQIGQHLDFVKKLRDTYRLKVAAHNVIEQEHLQPVAESMGYGDSAEAAEELYNDFLKRTAEAAGVIQRLVEKIKI